MGPALSAVVGFRCGRRANRLFYKGRYRISGTQSPLYCMAEVMPRQKIQIAPRCHLKMKMWR